MSYVSLDIADKDAVDKVISDVQPDAVIHCAAWTAVDAAEDEENKDKVHRINAEVTKYIASACRNIDAKKMHISTDLCFNGQGTEHWHSD